MPIIIVRGLSRARSQGKLHLGGRYFLCALGRGGRRPKKQEGDGVTPKGRWSIRQVFYRPDRIIRPSTALPVTPLTPSMGWCDAPSDANYNRLVSLPFSDSHEKLWRQDNLYDLVAVLGYNDRPRARGRGSAIFLHLARKGYTPTEGCIAVSQWDMLRILSILRPGDAIEVE